MTSPFYYQATPSLSFSDIVDGRLGAAGVCIRELHPIGRERLLEFGAESLLMSCAPQHDNIYFVRESQQSAPNNLLRVIQNVFKVEIFDENDSRIWDGFGSMDRLTDYRRDVKKELAHLHQQDIGYARYKVRDHYSKQRRAPGTELPLPDLSDLEWEVLETNPDELLEFFWDIARAEADAKRRGKAGCVIGNPPGLLNFDDLFAPPQHTAQAVEVHTKAVADRPSVIERMRRRRASASDI
jgi:hypothetical protein